MGQCTSKHESKRSVTKSGSDSGGSKLICRKSSSTNTANKAKLSADDPDSGHHSTPDPALAASTSTSDCSDLPEDWTPSKMKYPDFARKISSPSYNCNRKNSSKSSAAGLNSRKSSGEQGNISQLKVHDVVRKPGCEMFVIGFDDTCGAKPTRSPKIQPPFQVRKKSTTKLAADVSTKAALLPAKAGKPGAKLGKSTPTMTPSKTVRSPLASSSSVVSQHSLKSAVPNRSSKKTDPKPSVKKQQVFQRRKSLRKRDIGKTQSNDPWPSDKDELKGKSTITATPWSTGCQICRWLNGDFYPQFFAPFFAVKRRILHFANHDRLL